MLASHGYCARWAAALAAVIALMGCTSPPSSPVASATPREAANTAQQASTPVPIQAARAVITNVRIFPRRAKPGDTLTVEITVTNASRQPIHSQRPDPSFTYVQGQTYDSQKFPSQDGAFRVGIDFGGEDSTTFPYRWGLGGDLAPGASTTVVGHVKLTRGSPSTKVSAGLIEEPSRVLRDGVGPTLITVTESRGSARSSGTSPSSYLDVRY